MNENDDILARMLEKSRLISGEREERNTSDFIEEMINKLRNTFFRDLGKCQDKHEKTNLIQHYNSESIKRMKNAQKNNDQIWTEIYSKFLKETLYLLKDFTITTEKQPEATGRSEVKPSAPPVVQNIPDSREEVKVVVDSTLDDWNLISLEEIMKILRYKDERSVKRWCEKNKVPIIELGKNKFIYRSFLEKIISTETEVKGHRAPTDSNVPKAVSRKADVTGNELYLKYLAKYESKSKPNPSS